MQRVSISVLSVLVLVLLCGVCELGFCREDKFIRMKLGGVRDCQGSQNSAGIESLARFAVQEFNKKENALLESARVLKAKEQVVAGKIYHLTLEAMDAGKKKIYEAKVWVKPWINFKQLQEFKHTEDGPSFTTSDLGVKRDGHAVKSIHQSPYQLLDIVLAKSKIVDLLLKLRGIKEKKFRVEVIKNTEGKFVLV